MDKHLFGKKEDDFDIKTLHSVEYTETGSCLLVNATERDFRTNQLVDFFCVIDPAGLLQHRVPGSSARVSPDGKLIAYESQGALMIYNPVLKEIRKIASIYPSDYFLGHMADTSFCWSPDSRSIAYISTAPYSHQEPPRQQFINRLLYKTKGGRGRNKFADFYLSHIWIAALENYSPYCITDGEFNEHSIAWSPDGNFIAFISNRNNNPDRTHQNDLLKVNVQTGEITTLVTGRGTRFKPSWSPSGAEIAFLADNSEFTSKDSPAPDTHVYTFSVAANTIRNLSAPLDRRADNIKWHPGGKRLFFLAGDRGSTSIYSVEPHGDRTKRIVHGKFMIKDYSVKHPDDSIAFIKNSITEADEIFVAEDNNSLRALTAFNHNITTQVRFSEADSFWVTSKDGITIQGWLMKPANFKEGNKYPLILVIHGGPHNMYGYEFDEKVQLLSASGFGVVYFNPRGSTGYGQKFTNGNLLSWGGNDYDDIMNGMAYVVNENTWIDKDRLGVTGQSYGGFMTNWIITQTSIFKAAVSDGGISNLISFAGTSIYHCLIEAEFNGNTWENYPLLWRCSPLKYVKSVKTPILFLHGENDNEVPVSQSEEMFSALMRLGVDTAMVRYVDEGHGWRPDLLPFNKIDTLKRMIDWFKKYCCASHVQTNNQ